jgi:hypothetical protein
MKIQKWELNLNVKMYDHDRNLNVCIIHKNIIFYLFNNIISNSVIKSSDLITRIKNDGLNINKYTLTIMKSIEKKSFCTILVRLKIPTGP